MKKFACLLTACIMFVSAITVWAGSDAARFGVGLNEADASLSTSGYTATAKTIAAFTNYRNNASTRVRVLGTLSNSSWVYSTGINAAVQSGAASSDPTRAESVHTMANAYSVTLSVKI